MCKYKLTHGNILIEVVKDRNLDGEDLAALDGWGQGQVNKEGREGHNRRLRRDADALTGMNTDAATDPFGDGVGKSDRLRQLTVRSGKTLFFIIM